MLKSPLSARLLAAISNNTSRGTITGIIFIVSVFVFCGTANAELSPEVKYNDIISSEINKNDIYEYEIYYKGDFFTGEFDNYGTSYLQKGDTFRFYSGPSFYTDSGFPFIIEYATTTDDYYNSLREPSALGFFFTPVNAQSFYSTGYDARIIGNNASWDTIHDSVSENLTDQTNTRLNAQASYAGNYYISRVFLQFDTSVIGDLCIATATLHIYSNGPNTYNDDGDSQIAVIDSSAGDTLSNDDYDATTFTVLSNYLDIDAGFSQWYELQLNSTGTSTINKTGYTYLALTQNHDILDSAPAGTYNELVFYASEYAGITNDPYLEIGTYTCEEEEEEEPAATSTTVSIPCDTSNFLHNIGIISSCHEEWGESTTSPEKTIYGFYYWPLGIVFFVSLILLICLYLVRLIFKN